MLNKAEVGLPGAAADSFLAAVRPVLPAYRQRQRVHQSASAPLLRPGTHRLHPLAAQRTTTTSPSLKNNDVVRRHVGYLRLQTEQEVELLDELNDRLRLLINFFYPSQKLVSKTRQGATVRPVHDDPQTPYQRVLACSQVSDDHKVAAPASIRHPEPGRAATRGGAPAGSVAESGAATQPSSRACRLTTDGAASPCRGSGALAGPNADLCASTSPSAGAGASSARVSGFDPCAENAVTAILAGRSFPISVVSAHSGPDRPCGAAR